MDFNDLLINFSDSFIPVTDPDEEVFILYTGLSSTTESGKESEKYFRGLGSVDSHRDILNVQFELRQQDTDSTSETTQHIPRRQKVRNRKVKDVPRNRTIDIQLHQDKTALRSRAGDTGSVLWEASLNFAQFLLQQSHSVPEDCRLLNYTRLLACHVLELGAGTGLLSIALAPLVRRFTVTDLEDLLPLIRKNIALNSNTAGKVFAEACDWIRLHEMLPTSRHRYFTVEQPVDLLLAVDCIYNPFLITPFVSAINHYATPAKTVVMIVVELRASDVIRDFLALWLESGQWRVWRPGNDLMHRRYAVWIGWKET